MNPFAIYFPQFYPTETNDKAWGVGFTDWVLVANANLHETWPRRAPAAGFYDGSSPAVHARQISELRDAGLGGFAVYHYWFYTRRELGAFEDTLLNGSAGTAPPPWFLIWASESWSKRWIARPDTLIQLSASPKSREIAEHCEHLARCFARPEYFRWRGRPLFVWYNLGHFERPEEVVGQYREALRKCGFDVAVAHFVKGPYDLAYSAFTDASYLFEPRLFFGMQSGARGPKAKALLDTFRKILGSAHTESLLVAMDNLKRRKNTFSAEEFLAYMSSPERSAMLGPTEKPRQEVLSPGWNNAPRYGDRFTALNSLDAVAFGSLVNGAMRSGDLPPLLNAWNEWSEGAAIEPCAYFGRRYLEAIGTAKAGTPIAY